MSVEFHPVAKGSLGQEEECSICHEELFRTSFLNRIFKAKRIIAHSVQGNDTLAHHAFHERCLGAWIIDNSNCPMCRGAVDIRKGVAKTVIDNQPLSIAPNPLKYLTLGIIALACYVSSVAMPTLYAAQGQRLEFVLGLGFYSSMITIAIKVSGLKYKLDRIHPDALERISLACAVASMGIAYTQLQSGIYDSMSKTQALVNSVFFGLPFIGAVNLIREGF